MNFLYLCLAESERYSATYGVPVSGIEDIFCCSSAPWTPLTAGVTEHSYRSLKTNVPEGCLYNSVTDMANHT